MTAVKLTDGQRRALVMLGRYEDVACRGTATTGPPTTVSANVNLTATNRLDDLGLAEVFPDPRDAHLRFAWRWRARITDAGRALLAEVAS